MTRPLQRLLLLSAILLRVSGVAAFTPAVSVGAKAYSLSASTVVSPPAIENTNDSDDDEAVEFPPPLSSVDRLKRAATFWSVAVPIVANYYGKFAEMKLREGLLGETMSDEEIESVWDPLHADGSAKLAAVISSLKGFYVKTAQIISSRQDLFPPQYTEALSSFTDNVDPMPASLVKAIIKQELLNRNEPFDSVFSEFDDVPLGSASIAQVHRAVLTEKYGGPREVAIKCQRPSIESKLLGDIANLISISKALRGVDALPLDYYTVFCELEKSLADEFDFVAEAVAMDRIFTTITTDSEGRPVEPHLLYLALFQALSVAEAREEMAKKGISPDSPEAKLFGRKLLTALTNVFGRTILETGFFHADPHPGNLFVLDDGSIGLIDFGQVKQISGRNRETLAKVMIALDDRKSDEDPLDLEMIGNLALELGVELNEDAQDEAAAAVAMWLFDGSVETLPGGYDKGELSPNSPVKELKSFPQDLVLVGRSSILIKGLSNRLGIPWSLSQEWAPIARKVLAPVKASEPRGRVRFRDILFTTRQWGSSKLASGVKRLPAPLRSRVVALVVRIQDSRARRAMTNKRGGK
ncbi:ABC1 family-like protein [Fragilaria crotonensis]|nr:ABC1 family-like protein [Fragilaria crotonensis]